jgi:hypothetical protein
MNSPTFVVFWRDFVYVTLGLYLFMLDGEWLALEGVCMFGISSLAPT